MIQAIFDIVYIPTIIHLIRKFLILVVKIPYTKVYW